MKLSSRALLVVLSTVAFTAPALAKDKTVSQTCEETAQRGIESLTSSASGLTAEQALDYVFASGAMKILISQSNLESSEALSCVTADQKLFRALNQSAALSAEACVDLASKAQRFMGNSSQDSKIENVEVVAHVMSTVLTKGIIQNHRNGNLQAQSACVLAHNDMSKLVTESSGIADYIRQNMPEHADRLD